MAESQDYHDFGEQSELNIIQMIFFHLEHIILQYVKQGGKKR